MNQPQSRQDPFPNNEGKKQEEQAAGDPSPPDSLSRQASRPQPDRSVGSDETPEASVDHRADHHTLPSAPISAHVVLYQPEIPQNTGNIGRSCVAVGAKLWIVRPAAFQLDDAKLRRAGLDYWKYLQRGDAANWDDLCQQLAGKRMFFFSRFATRSIWDTTFERDDVFVFGRETSGLPASILDPHDPRALRLPTTEHVRSLNLATTVGIVLYEHQRQLFHQSRRPQR